jgi:hypothetical protein
MGMGNDFQTPRRPSSFVVQTGKRQSRIEGKRKGREKEEKNTHRKEKRREEDTVGSANM